MKVVVSVPGKIHLMGEHAVVHGKPAILAAINMRLTVTIEDVKGHDVQIISSEPTDYVRHAIDVVQKEYRIDRLPGMKVTVTSEIPAGFHLGSSAATAVATVGAVTYFLKKLWNPIAINQLAYEVEKKQHGNPSGGDNTIVTMGGFLWFRKELEFLKSIWQLPFTLPKHLNHFFLINTGRPKETTGEMVALVNAKCKVQSAKFQKIFNMNEIQTKRVTVALKEGNEKELMDAIHTGERTLEDMGVVSSKVMPLIRLIEKAEGSAKILGGGGRADGVGFLLCYHHDQKIVERLCKPLGYFLKNVILGEEGIRLKQRG